MSLSIDQSLSKAKRHAKRGETERAAAIYRQILEKFPANRIALAGLQGLGPSQHQMDNLITLYTSGQLDEALAAGNALARQFPYSPFIPNALGAVNAGLGRTVQAVACYEAALELKPAYAEARNNLADSLNALGRPDAALATVNRALELEPDFAEAHNNKGNALYLLGRIDEAAACYARAIELLPDYAEAHRNLSTVKKYQESDEQVRQMRALITRPDQPERARMNLGFALAKAHDDFGDHDTAFAFLAEANRLRKTALPYDIGNDIDLFARIRTAFSADLPAPTSAAISSEDAGPAPIFIVGMPRSGTTLVEQILASHSQVLAAGELTLFDSAVAASGWETNGIEADALRRIRDAYCSGIADFGNNFRFLTDKMPLNFIWIGFIRLALPQAKIVHVRRDARATCWSNFRHFFSGTGNRFANNLVDVARYFGLYSDLMTFWHARFPGQIYDLNYQALTENQTTETRRLLEYAGLDWEPQCLDFHRTVRAVQTASAAQVRQKMYTGSSEAWRRYERHLQPMLKLLDVA